MGLRTDHEPTWVIDPVEAATGMFSNPKPNPQVDPTDTSSVVFAKLRNYMVFGLEVRVAAIGL